MCNLYIFLNGLYSIVWRIETLMRQLKVVFILIQTFFRIVRCNMPNIEQKATPAAAAAAT